MSIKRTDIYQLPLNGRYASYEMQHLFSDDVKFQTWRRLWTALAKVEKQLGLDITDNQIAEMEAHINDINYDVANEREKIVRHDVMAHVYAFGVQAPSAAPIIHLGATSCYVTDNTDIIVMRSALELIQKRLLGVIKLLADFADRYKSMPTLGYTHGQPAAPVTVGKRASLWLQNFMLNHSELLYVMSQMKLLGCRGATGTQDTFLELFEGAEYKAKAVENFLKDEFGFVDVFPVSGQTYTRNLDCLVLNCLSNIAVSVRKMTNDIRLLQSFKEIEEPFAKNQIGSSAMAYKRNPMRSERACGLATYVQTEAANATQTASVQWFERTLDDSANRRLSIAESFLSTDGILILCANITDGLVVNDAVIAKRLKEELPFMATEKILMKAVKAGGNRQELHERIRQHSMAAGERVKKEGLPNDLPERIANDPEFNMTLEEVQAVLDPNNLVGRCAGQVVDYLLHDVHPMLDIYKSLLEDIDTTVKV